MFYLKNKVLVLCFIVFMSGCETVPTTGQLPPESAAIPDVDENNFERAIWSAQSGDLDQAIVLLNDITQKNPDLAIVYRHLGVLHIRQNDFSAAEQALMKSVKLYGHDPIAYNHLGIAKRGLGKFTRAREAYNKAIELKPDYADAILNLGILYDLYLHQLDRALIYYTQFLSVVAPKDKQALLVEKWKIDIKNRQKRVNN